MNEGQPTYKEMCTIIDMVYADAYSRIDFLERENRALREATGKKWNNGSGNSMLPESLLEELRSKSTIQSTMSSGPLENSDVKVTRFTEKLDERLS